MSDLLKKALQNGETPLTSGVVERPPPSEGLRSRLLQTAVLEGRFERFVDAASGMLDLSPDDTRKLLDRVDSKDSFAEELPGVEFFWLPGGPKTEGAVRGFVRINRQAELPPHVHDAGHLYRLADQRAFRPWPKAHRRSRGRPYISCGL